MIEQKNFLITLQQIVLKQISNSSAILANNINIYTSNPNDKLNHYIILNQIECIKDNILNNKYNIMLSFSIKTNDKFIINLSSYANAVELAVQNIQVDSNSEIYKINANNVTKKLTHLYESNSWNADIVCNLDVFVK